MRAAIAALLASLVAAPVAAAAPPDLSGDALDRGALLALPSVYRIDATIRVDALRFPGGRTIALPPRLRDISEVGTAVAVAPDGWLVTARHVAAPDPATVARLAYQTWRAGRGQEHGDDEAAAAWVRRTGAEAVPGRVTLDVTPAGVGGPPAPDASRPAVDVVPSPTVDLALVRIDAPNAPALDLDPSATKGTPIAVIGFGRDVTDAAVHGQADEPSVRRGVIRLQVALGEGDEERQALIVSSAVAQGDSGGPVVDADGHVRGIVIIRYPSGGIAEQATEVRQLLVDNGVEPGEGATAGRFRAAMQAFWRLDLDAAAQGLRATLATDPGHALAAHELGRTESLARSGLELRATDRRDQVLIAVAVLAIVGAACCAIALGLPSLRRARGGQGGG